MPYHAYHARCIYHAWHTIQPVLHHSHDIGPSLLQKSAQELCVTAVEHSWHSWHSSHKSNLIVAGARTFCTFLYISSETVQSHALKNNQEASSYLRVSRFPEKFSQGFPELRAANCAALRSRALSKCVIPQLRLEPCTYGRNKVCPSDLSSSTFNI